MAFIQKLITMVFILIIIYLLINKYPDNFAKMVKAITQTFGFGYSALVGGTHE